MSRKIALLVAAAAAFAPGHQTVATAAVVVSDNYYEQVAEKACMTNIYVCRLDFEPIPVNKILDLQRVNCRIKTWNGEMSDIAIGAAATLGGSSSRPVALVATKNFPSVFPTYTVDQEMKYRVGQSRFIHVVAVADRQENFEMRCMITGTLSPRP